MFPNGIPSAEYCYFCITFSERKMKLHIFNPEHDLALAANIPNFTAPHAARQLRADLDFLPALWADEGDWVLVDDVDAVVRRTRHLRRYMADVEFVTPKCLGEREIDGVDIQPWGHDTALNYQLLQMTPAFAESVLSDFRLGQQRQMSGRPWAAKHLLPALTEFDGTVGKSWIVTSMDGLREIVDGGGDFVLKAPWSSSGRGNRYWLSDREVDTHLLGWCDNIIRKQHALMVEPLYNKVLDFGVEFYASGAGQVNYLGLSMFRTVHGVYRGNLLMAERQKEERLQSYIPARLIQDVCNRITLLMGELLGNTYIGPFGVDMMVVTGAKKDGSTGDFLLHPMIELNLRRTMGHVALSLSAHLNEDEKRVMVIDYADRYRLHVVRS